MENAFLLQIFVTNKGNAIARNARIVVAFEHLNIKKILKGPKSRIDDLRKGTPTLQYDSANSAILPNFKNKELVTLIWELQVTPTTKLLSTGILDPGIISWEAWAEDMEYLEGKKILIPLPIRGPNSEGNYLQTPEVYFGVDKVNNGKESD
jgi:hypothetical protein